MSNRTLPVSSRGLLSTLAYGELFNRNLSLDYIKNMINSNRETLIIYLTADEYDWNIRMKIAKHEPINYTEHKTVFDKWADTLYKNDLLVFRFNTTKLTPYQIAEMVMTIIEEENNK